MQQRRGLKPPPAPVRRPACCESDEDSQDDLRSLDEARVQPLETPGRPRKDGSVCVAVRIRPMLPRELARNAATCVQKARDEENAIELLPTALDRMERKFTFDYVFPQSTNQTELYDEALRPWMSSFLQGFNVTVIAYGQTGSGKTHTMGNSMPSTSMMANSLFARSPSSDGSSDDEAADDALDCDEGLIPRFLHHLFAKLNETGGKFQLSVSFLEIYGEDIHDLLEHSDAQRAHRRSEPLQLRESKKNGVWVQGLTEVHVTNRQEAMEQMRLGSLQRITASTQMNERSSRSHAVYTVKIVQQVSVQDSKQTIPEPNNQELASVKHRAKTQSNSPSVGGDAILEVSNSDAVIVSKLTFVDLAGSERLKKTLAEGERMKEGIQINVGLFALGNVINALGDEIRRGGPPVHVPYRSSKLTRLLQDALGGNSRTLFIACISPADSNANETLNTLQYANRAKNIQNKAVKNIDSRSAELVNLKAFNELLSRELIKAILGRQDEGASVDLDNLVDTCMANPKVHAYLSRLKELAVSAAEESSGDEHLFETRRLLDGLTAYIYELAPYSSYERCTSLRVLNERETKNVDPHDEVLDLNSDSESSVAIMEDQKPDADVAFVTPYPLGKLCKTLDAMNIAFEMQEIQQLEKRQRESFKARITRLESRYHRQALLRSGMSDMIERMKTRLSCHQTMDEKRSVERNVEEAVEKLELMDIEMQEVQRKKNALACDLEVEGNRCRTEWALKQEQMKHLREIPEEATTNALNVLTRRTEIKVRFDGYDLDSILTYLNEEEKEMAAFIDEGDTAISFMSSLFTKEELSSSQSREILSLIQEQLRIAFDKEALEASMSKELRKRAQLFHNVTTGLMACHRGEMTEQEFMETNEQNLKDCEDTISQLRGAMRAKRGQRASMTEIIDSIHSLDAAKDVMRRLIVEIYSHWRIYMFFDEEEAMRQQREAEEIANQKLAAMKADMDKRIEELETKYVEDVQCAFQMISSFNRAARPIELSGSSESKNKVAELEEREKHLMTQLAERESEIVRMRNELEQFQSSAKSMEMKEESFRLMSKCQEIWKELGLNEEEQARKFQNVNKLLVKKCSEELEGLEAAREKLQARIDGTYNSIRRMELILLVADTVDIHSLSSVAGVTLLEQDKYLLTIKNRLTKELWQRVNTRVRTTEGIVELATGLQIRTGEDFRHVAQDNVGGIDVALDRSLNAELKLWKEFQQNPDTSSSLEAFLENLDDIGCDTISSLCIQEDELLLNVLLKEKTKRISELEESLIAIRSVARKMRLTHEEIAFVIDCISKADDGTVKEVDACGSNVFEELSAWIFQTGGQLDLSKRGLEALAEVLRGFKEVYAGRTNALEFLHRTQEEAVMLTQDASITDAGDDEQQKPFALALQQITLDGKGEESFQDTLASGKKLLDGLTEPVERSLRSLFYSMNDDFAAFGIDTAEQRVSFFLGQDGENEVRHRVVEKYALLTSSWSSDKENETSCVADLLPPSNDSFLSRLDPVFNEFHRVYSVAYGKLQLRRLRDSIADMGEVKNIIRSAQNRLRSLQKIMKIFNKINEFKAKIAEFEASASQKDRLFGNSLRLLEEERFRKMAAKHYPNLLASLRKEVTRWLENEDGEYNLSVLGEDLKNLLVDMMNTDTGLMHLDLGTVRRPSKPSPTPTLSSSNLQRASSESGQRAATPARARTQSLNSRAHTPRPGMKSTSLPSNVV